MTFIQKISAYVIGQLTEKDIPDIGLTGLQEGLDSPNLEIMAGLNKNENPFLLHDYFLKALRDLEIELPDKTKAIMTVSNYYTDKIINGQIDPYDGFEELIKAIDTGNIYDDTFQLLPAYCEYITMWETTNEGLQLYDNLKMTKEQFLVESKKALVDTLKERKKILNAP